MKKSVVLFNLVLFLILLVGCAKTTPEIPKPEVLIPPKEEANSNSNPNSNIVTNIHYVFGTVKEKSVESITIESENQKTLTFDLINTNPTNVDSFKVNDIVKVYYRTNLEEDGSQTIKLIRLEVINPAPLEESQTIIGIVLQSNGDSLILEVGTEQVITVSINPIYIPDLPKIYAGDIIKVYYPGTIDLSTPTNINATKIEIIKSSITQL